MTSARSRAARRRFGDVREADLLSEEIGLELEHLPALRHPAAGESR